MAEKFFQSIWFRAAAAFFFVVSGAVATLMLLLGTPSFWYFPCAVLWTLSGFVWLTVPSWAPGLSLFPVLGMATALVQMLPKFRQTDSIYRILLLCVVIALVLVAASFRVKETRKILPGAVSFGIVLSIFITDRLFTNKIAVHAYSMSWSANGAVPWGQAETDDQGSAPVVIFRHVKEGYCYDAIFSPEPKTRLVAANKATILVEYNTFSDFGRERSYNIRSVDGMIFNEGDKTIRSAEGYGGTILDPSGSASCER